MERPIGSDIHSGDFHWPCSQAGVYLSFGRSATASGGDGDTGRTAYRAQPIRRSKRLVDSERHPRSGAQRAVLSKLSSRELLIWKPAHIPRSRGGEGHTRLFGSTSALFTCREKSAGGAGATNKGDNAKSCVLFVGLRCCTVAGL